MFLSNPSISFVASILIFVFIAGCGFRQNDRAERSPLISETKHHLPFPTKEPDNFQCEIVVTTGQTVRKTFAARKGKKSRIDYNFGEENQSSVLQSDREYLIGYKKKIYADNSSRSYSDSNDFPLGDLTSGLLNRSNHAEFEEIGRENNLITYKVRISESDVSEVFIYVDETIGMPVKQEFFSGNEEEKILQYSVELRNFKTDADESLFEIPKGFRKVSLEEFHRTLP